jgi:hypothetical protein
MPAPEPHLADDRRRRPHSRRVGLEEGYETIEVPRSAHVCPRQGMAQLCLVATVSGAVERKGCLDRARRLGRGSSEPVEVDGQALFVHLLREDHLPVLDAVCEGDIDQPLNVRRPLQMLLVLH